MDALEEFIYRWKPGRSAIIFGVIGLLFSAIFVNLDGLAAEKKLVSIIAVTALSIFIGWGFDISRKREEEQIEKDNKGRKL